MSVKEMLTTSILLILMWSAIILPTSLVFHSTCGSSGRELYSQSKVRYPSSHTEYIILPGFIFICKAPKFQHNHKVTFDFYYYQLT